jgi:hypothetical protein
VRQTIELLFPADGENCIVNDHDSPALVLTSAAGAHAVRSTRGNRPLLTMTNAIAAVPQEPAILFDQAARGLLR